MNEEIFEYIEKRLSEIKEEIKQECMLLLPEVAGHLYMETVAKTKALHEFMKGHQGLAKHMDMLKAEVEKAEDRMPGTDYTKILEEAATIVNANLKIMDTVNLTDTKKPLSLEIGEL